MYVSSIYQKIQSKYKFNSFEELVKKINSYNIFERDILKDYLIKGYAINERRLIALNKTIDIQNRMLSSTLHIDNEELSNVVNAYTEVLSLLDDYDHQTIKEVNGRKTLYQLTYDDCRTIIDSMEFSKTSNLFGVEKEEGKLRISLELLS